MSEYVRLIPVRKIIRMFFPSRPGCCRGAGHRGALRSGSVSANSGDGLGFGGDLHLEVEITKGGGLRRKFSPLPGKVAALGSGGDISGTPVT